jgi:hypothetical protein
VTPALWLFVVLGSVIGGLAFGLARVSQLRREREQLDLSRSWARNTQTIPSQHR